MPFLRLRRQHVLHVQRHRVEPVDAVHPSHQPRRLFQQLLPRLAERGHHRELRQPRPHRSRHRLRVLPRLVDQQVLEPRHPAPVRLRPRNQLRELPIMPPRLRSLIEYHRHDQRQLRLVLVLPVPPHPGQQAVVQQPQPHPPVRRGLMFEQHVDEHRLAGILPLDREQQVGLPAAPVVADEAAGHVGEGGPPQRAGDLLGQVGAQQAGGIPGVGEHAVEVLVVRMADRRLRRGGLRSVRRLIVGHETRRRR